MSKMSKEQSWKVEIPLPMPTWNRILQMHQWERKKLRDLIHHAVQAAVNNDQQNDLEVAEYYALIRPSEKNRTAVKLLRAEYAAKKKR